MLSGRFYVAGRFAFFLYPPDLLQMNEEDRIRVAMHINGDDAPSRIL